MLLIAIVIAVIGTLTGAFFWANKANLQTYSVKLYVEDTLYSSFSAKKGEKITIPATLEMENYDFLGWFYDENVWQEEFDPDTVIDKDITLYAYVSEHITEVENKVEIKVYGGTFGQGNSFGYFYKGSRVTITANTMLGKKFSYWQIDGDETHYTENPYTFTASFDYNFTAVFEDIKTYNVSIINGGYIDDNQDTVAKECNVDTQIKLTAKIPIGKKFVCWRIDNEEISVNPYTITVTKDLEIETLFVDFDGEDMSRGLHFIYDEEKQSYTLTRFVYSNEINVDIPSHYDNGINGDNAVTCIANNVFEYSRSLIRIIIPPTITEIQDRAFKDCDGLYVIYIPKTVKFIGNNVFQGCSKLKIFCDASDSGFWSSNWNSEELVVSWNCGGYGETEDGFKYIQTSSNTATIIAYMGTQNDIEIPSYCGEEVEITAISGGAFFEHEQLTRITLPAGIVSIGESALIECNRLLSIKIGALLPPEIFSTSLILLKNADALKLYVPSEQINEYKTSAIWSDYSEKIYSLESIDVSGFAIENGKLIQYLGNSVAPIIPESVAEIDKLAFIGCNVENIDVSDENQHFSDEDGVLYSKDLTRLVHYPNQKNDTSFVASDTVLTVSTYAFFENHFLEKVDFSSVNNLEDNALCNCNKIREIYLRSENPEYVGMNGLGYNFTYYVPSQVIETYKDFMEEKGILQTQIVAIP